MPSQESYGAEMRPKKTASRMLSSELPAPRPPSEITEALNAQTEANSLLLGMLDRLEKSLESVLSPNNPETAEAGKDAPYSSQLGAAMYRQAKDTNYAVHRIGALLDRINL